MRSLDAGLLILRLAVGGMLLTHGLPKAVRLFQGQHDFADPLGLGPLPTLIIAVLVEVVCVVLVMVGFKARWAAVPVVLMMLVAAFVYHSADPWGVKEKPLLYATVFLALVLTGAGRYALDAKLAKRR